MLLSVFHIVTDIFRRNYIFEIMENAPVRDEYQSNEIKERTKDIGFIV